MEHLEALSTKASERYVLGEMSEPERFAFEAHYFECGECADDVRAGAAFRRGVRAVFAEEPEAVRDMAPVRKPKPWWDFSWLRPSALVPAAAVLFLGCVVGYQSLVTIPSLRSSRALAPVVLRAAARGDEQTVVLQAGQPYSILSLDVNAAEPGTALVYEIVPDKGPVRSRGTATAPPPGSPLLVVIPHSDLDQAGSWNLVLRTSQGPEIARYPFLLKLN